MYDPMIVDTFLEVYSTATSEVPRHGPPSDVLNTIARSRRIATSTGTSTSVELTAAGTDEMMTAFELAGALAGQVGLADAGNAVAKHLRRLVPSATCVFYVYDRSSDKLEARHVVGEGGAAIRGLRIGLGQRLSGWVAANRQTILNSDAALDLGDEVKSVSPRLRTSLSTPLVFHDELIGVVTLYSNEQTAFDDQHHSAIDGVSHQIAQIVKRATDFDRDHGRMRSAGRRILSSLSNSSPPKPPEIRRAFPPFSVITVIAQILSCTRTALSSSHLPAVR